jgi:ABC-2 type transport system ATP-binding protein
MTPSPLLEAERLSHRYGAYQALAPVDLALYPGDLAILSGPNGAGKTTLLLCLSGLLHPTTGQVRVCGYDLYRDEPSAKSDLAFVPDVPRFYTELTAWEHLHFVALAHGAGQGFEARAESLLKEFNLWDERDHFPHHFSRGMRLKLGLLMAFIRPFSVLLLDEPTSALDQEGAELARKKILDLRHAGAAILLSSHDPFFSQGMQARTWRMRNGELWQDAPALGEQDEEMD